jgi:hypothetical protein
MFYVVACVWYDDSEIADCMWFAFVHMFVFEASCVMHMTFGIGERLLQACTVAARCGVEVVFGMLCLSWDETSKILSFPLNPAFSTTQKRSNWHVCVSQAHVDVVWQHSASREFRHHHYAMLRPNVGLINTSAEALHQALFGCPVAARLHDQTFAFLRSAMLSCVHFSRDAAASNLRLCAYLFSRWSLENPNMLFTELDCALHQNHLIAGLIIKPFLGVVSKLYMISGLTNMGANFLRLVNVLPRYVIPTCGHVRIQG